MKLIPKVFEKLLIVLLATIVFIGVPLILVISAPFYLIRIFVSNLAKCVKPKHFGKMVTCQGTPFTVDDLSKPKGTASMAILLEGNVDVPGAQKLIEKRLFEEARYPNGDLKFPELKQYMNCWLGYYFWKDDTTFDIKNHIKIHEKCTSSNNDHFTKEDIDEFREQVFNREWPKKRSLWDLTFVPNCYPNESTSSGSPGSPTPHTLMILRHHHAIGDGISWLPLFMRNICKAEVKFPQPNYVKRSPVSQLLYGVTFPFRMAYDLADLGLSIFESSFKAPFRVTKRSKNWKYFMQTSRKISLKKLKEIKSHFQISLSSVLFAVISGAIRDFLIQKGLSVPMTLKVAVAQPLPNHCDKLRNHLTGNILTFPTGKSDPIERLNFSHQDLGEKKRSTIPSVFHFFYLLLGVFPSFINRILVNNFYITTGMSNFAGSPQPITFHGVSDHKWVEHTFAVGLQPGCAGLAFMSVGYVDDFRIISISDSSVITKDDLKKLTDLMEKHVDILHNLSVINDV